MKSCLKQIFLIWEIWGHKAETRFESGTYMTGGTMKSAVAEREPQTEAKKHGKGYTKTVSLFPKHKDTPGTDTKDPSPRFL